MNEKELQKELGEIRGDLKLFDLMLDWDMETGGVKLEEKQAKTVKKLFDLFRILNWQLAFNNYKELKTDTSEPINKKGCGTPVKVRSCKDEHENKTYFGILLGDIPLHISHTIDDNGNVTAARSMYNPAIFIPKLNDIIFGCESWWGEIKDETELDKLITDETIQNVWYVKLLNALPK